MHSLSSSDIVGVANKILMEYLRSSFEKNTQEYQIFVNVFELITKNQLGRNCTKKSKLNNI